MTLSLTWLTPVNTATTPTALALHLDRLADAELQHGHHGAAERLDHTAAAMREARP